MKAFLSSSLCSGAYFDAVGKFRIEDDVYTNKFHIIYTCVGVGYPCDVFVPLSVPPCVSVNSVYTFLTLFVIIHFYRNFILVAFLSLIHI